MFKVIVEFDAVNEKGDSDSDTISFEYDPEMCRVAALIDTLGVLKIDLVDAWGPSVKVTDLCVSVVSVPHKSPMA